MKLVLKKPIQLGSDPEVTELVFRDEICAGDLRGIKLSSIADMATDDVLKIAGRLCAKPDAVMNKLGAADLFKVVEVVGGFLADGLGIGTAASQS